MIKMKDSGIPWIGQIPEDWVKCFLKNSFNFEKGKNASLYTSEYLSDNKGEIPVYSGQTENNGIMGFVKDYDYFSTGCLFVTTVGAKAMTIKILKGKFCLSQNCLIMQEKKNININFWFYALQILFDYEKSIMFGIMQPSLRIEDLKKYAIFLPNKEIQQKIVEILDKKCGQIDELVRIEENEIEKLKEYKTSLITKVVTKGLDSNAKMKDSGIPWIGQIPESWITIKIKFTSWLKGRIGWDGLKSSEFKEDGPFLITGTDFNNGNIKWDTCAHITEERFMEDELLHVKEGDLLITKDGTIGKLAIVKNCPEKVSLNSGVMIIRNNSNWTYDNKYLYYILLSNQFYLWYEKSQNGNSTIKHLYQEQFYNFEFSYPNILYQKRIVAYLDNKCEEIDNLIKIKQEKIEKLKEYKKSLIYQYVTGKKEVV